MTQTNFGLNHPLAVKLWAKKLFQDALKETYVERFIGKGSSALVQMLDDTKKGKGDKITVGLRLLLTGDGVQGDDVLEGNEEAITLYNDSIYINQTRHAVHAGGRMSDQRVPFESRSEAKDALKDWLADRLDTSFFNQICGVSTQTNTNLTGNNAALAPSSTRIVYADDNTAESTLTSGTSDRFKLSLIDKAVTTAKTASPLIRPVKVDGVDHYVCFLDPWQVYQLRTGTDTMGWADIQKAALSGGKIKDNPIFTGALGVYNNVVLHESTRVYNFTTDGGTRAARAVLCGAQSAAIAFGRDNSPDVMTWVEETFDYGNQIGVAAGLIYGLKKTQFNSVDYGTVVISTTAPTS